MLELVFVIVVIGILAALIIPRIDRDTLYEATEQVLGHIKYTQHLAMTDNVYDDDASAWYLNRWRMTFTGNQYEVHNGAGGVTARDALTKELIDGAVMDDYDMNDKYSVSISPVNFTIAFDHVGRPYNYSAAPTSPVSDLLTQDYNITLTSGTDKAIITISAETGYSYITW